MIYVIVGPTASNKTKASIEIANRLSAPIINADAFQIYKDMNIGTAKISKDDQYYKNHYLLDLVTPDQSFSVKEYQSIFRKTLNDLLNKHKDVVICGGTGLYIKASLYDYEFLAEDDNKDYGLDKLSNEELYNELVLLDKSASEKIHPNNRKRLIRALTLIKNNNIKKSDLINNQLHELIYDKDNIRFLFINPPRELLYENINKRVDDMFDHGLVDEVKNLLIKYNLSITAKQAIGYKEVIDYLNGLLTLEECKELIKKRTRNYAKRQVTFFKNQFKCETFESFSDLLKEIFHE